MPSPTLKSTDTTSKAYSRAPPYLSVGPRNAWRTPKMPKSPSKCTVRTRQTSICMAMALQMILLLLIVIIIIQAGPQLHSINLSPWWALITLLPPKSLSGANKNKIMMRLTTSFNLGTHRISYNLLVCRISWAWIMLIVVTRRRWWWGPREISFKAAAVIRTNTKTAIWESITSTVIVWGSRPDTTIRACSDRRTGGIRIIIISSSSINIGSRIRRVFTMTTTTTTSGITFRLPCRPFMVLRLSQYGTTRKKFRKCFYSSGMDVYITN